MKSLRDTNPELSKKERRTSYQTTLKNKEYDELKINK